MAATGERIRVHAAEQSGETGRVHAASAPNNKQNLVDVIVGARNPELFLSTEVFEDLVNLGLVLDDNWRGIWSKGVIQAGLPPDFWRRLGPIVQTYADDLKLKAAAVQRLSTAKNPAEKDRAYGEVVALGPTICRDRFDALSAARVAFGPGLDRFMYQTIAPGKAIFVHSVRQDPDVLAAQARGCR